MLLVIGCPAYIAPGLPFAAAVDAVPMSQSGPRDFIECPPDIPPAAGPMPRQDLITLRLVGYLIGRRMDSSTAASQCGVKRGQIHSAAKLIIQPVIV